jgi:HK97 family phage portal protein
MFNILSAFRKAKAIIPSNYSIATLFSPVSGLSQIVTDDSAMKFTTIYSCVKVLSESLATLPLNLYNEKGGKREKLNNKLTKALKRPNSFTTDFDFKSSIMVDLALRGNSYWQVVRSGLNDIVGIYQLDARNMTVSITTTGDVVYQYTSQTNGLVVLENYEVLHFKTLSLDGINGISPISYNQLSIASGMSQVEYLDKFYANGANSNVVLSHPSILSDEAYERLKGSFSKQYTGVKNSNKPILLEDSMRIEKLSINNTDSQYIETRTFTKNEIASIYRIPPHMVNEMSKSTFSNIEHQSLEFVKHTLMPYIVMIESELNEKLIKGYNQYFKFDINSLVRGDQQTRYTSYQIAIQNGWLSRNEVRALEDLDSVDGLDEYLTPLNMGQVTKDGQDGSGSELTATKTKQNINNDEV